MNRTARRTAGANISMRIESMTLRADIRDTVDQYVINNANIFDRVLRAKGTAAQLEVQRTIWRKKAQVRFGSLREQVRFAIGR